MATYDVAVRYSDRGTPTTADLVITCGSPAEAYIKDGDTYRLLADNGITYVIPEGVLIFLSITEKS